jgi:hypothetical protein
MRRGASGLSPWKPGHGLQQVTVRPFPNLHYL